MRRALALLLVLSACAVAPAGPPKRSGGDADEVRTALHRATPPARGPVNDTGHPMAFVVGARGSALELWGFDLQEKRPLWHQRADVNGRVAIARHVVVHTDRSGALVARDLRTGAVNWQKRLDTAFTRVGYAAGGETVVEVVQTAGGSAANARQAAIIAYDAVTGRERWTEEVEGPVGAPAVWGGLVAVLRQSQWVSLFHAERGRLLAELLSREEAATFVKGLPEGLFFGSRGVFLASEETALALRGSSGYAQAKVPAFVRPLYHHDMYRPEQNEHTAIDRNRLLWRMQPAGVRAAFMGGLVVVHNFRFFFGLDARTGGLRWAYNNPRRDAMSSEHTGASIVFVSSDGTFGALDADSGRRVYEAQLTDPKEAVQVVGATFDADGFAPRESVREPAATTAEVLASILWDPDKRFSDVRFYALEELAQLPGRGVTEELLKALDMGDVVPGPVQKKVMDALISRQDRGVLDLYMKALAERPDYAEDRQAKRLDFFARAVAELKATEAVPLLVEHLRLPETDPELVQEIANAVLTLQAKEALPAFQDFLLQYRADPAFARRPGALGAAADVLWKLGGAAEKGVLLFVAEAPHTVPALATHIRRTFRPEPGL